MEQQSTNTFLKSKMNKDLDERLVPNGEYRDAVNIAISKSEDSNVGAAENVQGTNLLAEVGTVLDEIYPSTPTQIIGQYVDEAGGYIYLFLTNQNRDDEYILDRPEVFNPDRMHWVCRYSINGNSIDVFAGGAFLNFSTYFPINNINLLETQLFWTDNLNQPRVLDITNFRAAADLPRPSVLEVELPYWQEDQISVCTYSPYKAIRLYKDIGDGELVTTLQNATNSNLPYINLTTILPTGPGFADNEIEADNPACVPGGGALNFADWVGLQCWTSDGQINPQDHAYISGNVGSILTITYRNGGTPDVYFEVGSDATLYVANQNPNWQEVSGETTYPGDQTFLENKFARFSYRFRFSDGTYSTIAPYTQECFIPKQYGYFLDGDEKATYESTVVSFMENLVNRILLQLIMPEGMDGNILYVNELKEKLNVSEIDIIYKESNSAALKVVQTIPENVLVSYFLESTPYATVAASTTFEIEFASIPAVFDQQEALLRVGGVVENVTTGITSVIEEVNIITGPPQRFEVVTTVSQNWTIGDEIIIRQPSYEFEYQNNEPFKTLPEDQVTRVYDKVPVKALAQEIISNRITYANFQDKHTPPDAIDYQVSVSGKFNPSIATEGSKCYTAYPNHTVKQNRNYQVGFVLSDRYGRTSTVILSSRPNETITLGYSTFGADTIYHPYKTLEDYDGQVMGFDDVLDWPGDSIKVLVNDVINSVKDGNGSPGLYNGDPTSINYNPLGWYSYKVVVKQKEQEYYNVYLPYIVNGLAQDFGSAPAAGPVANPDIPPTFVEDSQNKQASVVLINDNINKVPRDLSEIGPDQEQFRSSVRLWGRVTPELPLNSPYLPVYWDNMTHNEQYYPDIVSDVVSTISTQNELYSGYVYQPSYLPDGGAYVFKPGTEFPAIYNSATNPLIATITTQKGIGASGLTDQSTAIGQDEWPYQLSIYETEPVESRLDIYWETSTSGLISDLNTAVIEDTIGVAAGIDDLVVDYKEDRDYIDADPATVYVGSGDVPYYTQFGLNPQGNPTGPIITSDFKFVDALGNDVNTVEIIDDENLTWDVVDGNGISVKQYFNILRTPGSVSNPGGDAPWNYRYDGVTPQEVYDTFVVTINRNDVYLMNQLIREYVFTVPTRSQNPAGDWITVEFEFGINLDNIAPLFQTLGPLTNFATNCFTNFGSPCTNPPANRPQIRAYNGTAIPDLATKDAEMTYEITSVIQNGQQLVELGIFALQPSTDPAQPPYTWEAVIVANNSYVVSGQYDIIIKACDCNATLTGDCTEQSQTWIFGETPVNCNFLMETADPNFADSYIIPTINPFQNERDADPCCQESATCPTETYCNGGIARGSDAAMIIWTSKYDAVTKEPEIYGLTPNNQLPLNGDVAGTGGCDDYFPAGIPVPYVWLWGNGNDPACIDIANPPAAGPLGCTQAPNTASTKACCGAKDVSQTNSLDMSYGPSWCASGPSGLTTGTGFITITYTQVVDPAVAQGNPALLTPGSFINSNFKVYLQYRRETPLNTDVWSDSTASLFPVGPGPAVPRARDIEGTWINDEDGILSGQWKVSNAEGFRLNGGVLYDDVDLPNANPYPIEYWEKGPSVGPENFWSTECQVQAVTADNQLEIQVSRTIAINSATYPQEGGYRLLISAIKGTLTKLTAASDNAPGCTYQYTNDNNCILTVEYGDFYYPNGTGNTAWKYYISKYGSGTQQAAQNYDGTMEVVWAREPFFRYVTQFYSDQQLTQPWVSDTAAGPWFMYRYLDSDTIIPGTNSNPYGNDAASYVVNDGTTAFRSTQDRRWICRLNATGNKIGRSFATAKRPV